MVVPFISLNFWAAFSSIPVMKMLAEQAENNILRIVTDADLPEAIKEYEYEDEHEDDEGNVRPYTQTYYTCGSCAGTDEDEVRSEYKHLISQLTRRSAFLTIFGLFEHRMVGCLGVMDHLSGEVTNKSFKTVDDCHKRLKAIMGGKTVRDTDHLTVIRNIMAHNDGTAEDYHQLLESKSKLSTTQRRCMHGLRRAMTENAGIDVNDFGEVLMDSGFLEYTAEEFERYISEMEAAVQAYCEKNLTIP